MKHIEKTVFISYRRRDVAWALATSQNLTQHGYDVFFDYIGIKSGDFEQSILGNIESRAHFLILLTPATLDRCSEPGDWLRREIEYAITMRRNIVPLMLEKFNFNSRRTKKQLSDKLPTLGRYQGLPVYPEYFYAAMDELRNHRLNVELPTVTHPPSPAAQEAAIEQQAATRTAPPIGETELTAEALFRRLNSASTAQTDKDAVSWFRKAAKTGNPYGMAGLGIMYASGRGGLSQNDVQAVEWLLKAAERGAVRAMTSMGFMYLHGRGGLPKDEVQAVHWYRTAADAGDFHGMANLGWMYQEGRGGLPSDDVQAVSLFRKAADAGDGTGLNSLGVMYAWGRGGLPKDDVQAAKCYRKAADAGDAFGMYNLALMYQQGLGGLPQDEIKAAEWLRKADQQNP